jgi:hypothetical protein
LKSYLQTGWQCGDQKKWGRPFSNDGAERLGGKQHFIYANETAIPKTVQCVQIVKSRVGIVKDKRLWKELIRLLSVDSQPTTAVLLHTCMGVFLIRSVSDTIFAMLLLLKPPVDHCRPQFSLRNTYLLSISDHSNSLTGSG